MDDFTLTPITKTKFMLATLLFWLLFLLIAIPQWMIMCLYSKKPLEYTLAAFIIGFILLTCMHFIEPLKYKRPWNFLLLFICYELITIGIGLFLTKWNLIHTLILIGVGIVISGFILLLSWLLIVTRAYANPGKIVVMGCLGFVLVFCIRSIDIFNRWFFLRDLEVFVFMICIAIVMLCHILITNENFDMLRFDDAMLVGFVLHLCYMLLLVGGRVATFCIESNVKYFKNKSMTTREPLKALHVERFIYQNP